MSSAPTVISCRVCKAGVTVPSVPVSGVDKTMDDGGWKVWQCQVFQCQLRATMDHGRLTMDQFPSSFFALIGVDECHEVVLADKSFPLSPALGLL